LDQNNRVVNIMMIMIVFFFGII